MPTLTAEERLAVVETCRRMAWCIDERDWTGLSGLFDDTVTIDYSSVFGGRPDTISGDSFALYLGSVLGQLTATQHLVTNHRVEPTEQGARCHSQVQATHVGTVADGGARWTGSGSYEIDLRRDERGWRITGYVFSASWNAGNRGLMTSAFQHRKGSNQSTSPIANGHRERR